MPWSPQLVRGNIGWGIHLSFGACFWGIETPERSTVALASGLKEPNAAEPSKPLRTSQLDGHSGSSKSSVRLFAIASLVHIQRQRVPHTAIGEDYWSNLYSSAYSKTPSCFTQTVQFNLRIAFTPTASLCAHCRAQICLIRICCWTTSQFVL